MTDPPPIRFSRGSRRRRRTSAAMVAFASVGPMTYGPRFGTPCPWQFCAVGFDEVRARSERVEGQWRTTAARATPERWQRALQRALFAGVEAKQLAGSGEWIVSSASRPGVAHRTDGVSCDCEAAMLGGDLVCLHRAAYWYAQGVLERDPEPEPPASAAPVAPLVVLGGWSVADEGVEDEAVAVACAGCGDRIYTEDPDDDTYCAACVMPAAEVSALRMVPAPTPVACLLCGAPIYRRDADDAGTRHHWCGRFITCLDAGRCTRTEEPLSA